MANMSVDGLISGLDTTTLISQLMSVERQPQSNLKTSQTKQQSVLSIYQALNTKLKALGDAADGLRTATDVWQTRAATSSDADAVVVTAGPGATASSLTFDVVRTASAHTILSGGHVSATTATVASGPLTVNGVTIADVGDGSLGAVINAINASTAGVVAVAVQTAPEQFQLQITAKSSGSAGAFTVSGLDAGITGAGFSIVTAGQDAELAVGATNPYTVVSSSNTFTDLLPGLTLTVKAPASGVTVDLTKNAEAVANKVQAFVTAANDVLSYISSNAKYDVDTRSAGALLADYTGGRIRDQLTDAIAGYASGGESAGAVGITLNRDGTVAFDRAKFLSAYASDPDKVAAHFQQGGIADTADDGLAERVHLQVKAATDFTTGYLTGAIANRNDAIKALGEQISSWDERLTIREQVLRKQFSNLETMLSKLQNQASWLNGQIASLAAS